jgi:hypothetical protein
MTENDRVALGRPMLLRSGVGPLLQSGAEFITKWGRYFKL